jgi:hypothetical protein
MFPPARPESLQDARAHRTEDRRLNGRGTAQPTFAPSQHVPAADEPQRSESDTQPHRPRRKQQNSRHPQYTTEQWDDRRPKIKDLYIDQNMSFEQTMKIMSEQFDFRPSLVPLCSQFRIRC